ncbi:hypothetical protein, partial [Ellagibacter isourolithinifaciens]|uniref:hypothetical protein n=1 Tax=Ellagibacter isourolithinifaciens TaxID=2137581 RepID=UPI003A90744B
MVFRSRTSSVSSLGVTLSTRLTSLKMGLILATRHRIGVRSVGVAVDVLSVVASTQAPTRLGGHQT